MDIYPYLEISLENSKCKNCFCIYQDEISTPKKGASKGMDAQMEERSIMKV